MTELHTTIEIPVTVLYEMTSAGAELQGIYYFPKGAPSVYTSAFAMEDDARAALTRECAEHAKAEREAIELERALDRKQEREDAQ